MVVRVDVCIGRTATEARDAVKYFVTLPLWSSYPDFGYVEDVGIEVPEGTREILARRDYGAIGEAVASVPPEMIDHFSVAGTREQVLDRLGSLSHLADEVIIHPVRSASVDLDEVITIVADAWHATAAPPLRGTAR
jgi:alkanesulfonate monooxygenase SsuD/methylene tetrahydromethanopterin reductase-like flavin-dependent oxidoreductase (luciferase family)